MKSYFNISIFLTFILGHHLSFSQRFSTGINLSTTAFQQTRLPDNFIYSQNSYYVYYTANEDKEFEPIFNQYFNSLSGGLNLNVDYKRFMLKYEFSIGVNNTKLRLLYPSPLLPDYLESDWSTFEVKRISFLHNLLLSTKLNKKANGNYLLTGIQYTMDSYKEQERFSLDGEISSGISLFISENELYGTLYNNNTNYFKGIIGLGVKRNKNYYSFRYLKRIFSKKEDYPLARYQHFEFTYTRTLSFQKLKKGYTIYIEE